MTSTVLLVHGWGFDAGVWDAVRPRLDGLSVRALDLGFFGPPDLALPAEPVDLAVGHSMGVLWLLTEGRGRWRRLASVNGFPRFTAAADFPEGTPPRMVQRMAARLADDPAGVLDAFRVRCGAGPTQRAPDAARLAWGLDLLSTGDGRPVPADTAALAGEADPIVPLAMARAGFSNVHALGGGHLLPLTDPAAVAAFIREALPSHE
ncbi:alpha/beta fold hydrolase [Caenispirillum bisanense]|uniref:Malonyl-CoA O-methyltransferase/pimeloyl-[acyl-carrier protein] methyl ester esterase n=1 Tax=Caenispirillum bisanense TaxID=414052 RepID=A0A286GMD4_9PROT|nr:alpha/beta hydrolase [Caenispirillum bisanense]SOD96670.1 malonyl-CoA O-methyltransferase/pimeloyl-[acyl-carrier protein] methyl ester esterase [Caenispirillum bisanense]